MAEVDRKPEDLKEKEGYDYIPPTDTGSNVYPRVTAEIPVEGGPGYAYFSPRETEVLAPVPAPTKEPNPSTEIPVINEPKRYEQPTPYEEKNIGINIYSDPVPPSQIPIIEPDLSQAKVAVVYETRQGPDPGEPDKKPGDKDKLVVKPGKDDGRMTFKEKMKTKKIPGGLTMTSFVLLLIGSQNIWSVALIISVSVTEFFGIHFLRDYLILYWWVSIIAAGVYGIVYLIVWRLKPRLRVSSACFFLIIFASLSESIMVIYLNFYIQAEVLSAMVQIIFCLYSISGMAQCLKKNYTAMLGKIAAIASSMVCLIFLLAFQSTTISIIILVNFT